MFITYSSPDFSFMNQRVYYSLQFGETTESYMYTYVRHMLEEEEYFCYLSFNTEDRYCMKLEPFQYERSLWIHPLTGCGSNQFPECHFKIPYEDRFPALRIQSIPNTRNPKPTWLYTVYLHVLNSYSHAPTKIELRYY